MHLSNIEVLEVLTAIVDVTDRKSCTKERRAKLIAIYDKLADQASYNFRPYAEVMAS